MAEEVWMLQTKKADFKQIGARFRIDPVTARIIRNRGIEGEGHRSEYCQRHGCLETDGSYRHDRRRQ